MKKSHRTTEPSHQQPLPFTVMNGQVELWNSLTQRHQQECRQVLRQMLVAVARHSRNAAHAYHGLISQDSESLTHD